MNKQINKTAFELRGLISRHVNIDTTDFYMTCPKCLSSFDYPEAWRDGDNLGTDNFGSSIVENYRCIFCENKRWNIDIVNYGGS